MRHTLFVPGVCFLLPVLFAACSSAPKNAEPGEKTVSATRTSVSVLARELHLSPGYDEGRNRLTLRGESGRVILYPGTSVALVNGYRLKGMSRVDRSGSGFTVERADAARIRTALAAGPPPHDSHHASRQEPSPALAPVRTTGSVPAGGCDPAWDVEIGRRWLYIVIHHSGTSAGSAASFHRGHRHRGWEGLGYHFVIGNGRGSPDGQVETGYRWSRQRTGAHAGRPRPDVNLMNERGVGICLVGDFNRTKPTAKQKEALHRLLRWLCARCDIPPNRVLVHRDVKGTECPGKHFPAREFLTPRRDVPKSYRQKTDR